MPGLKTGPTDLAPPSAARALKRSGRTNVTPSEIEKAQERSPQIVEVAVRIIAGGDGSAPELEKPSPELKEASAVVSFTIPEQIPAFGAGKTIARAKRSIGSGRFYSPGVNLSILELEKPSAELKEARAMVNFTRSELNLSRPMVFPAPKCWTKHRASQFQHRRC